MDEEKTEQPTAKRRQDAQKKGQIAQSRDLNSALVLLGSAILVLILGPAIYADIEAMIIAFICTRVPPTGLDIAAIHHCSFHYLLVIAAPFLAGIAVLTVLVYGVQTRFSIFEGKLAFSPDKLDPVANLRNLFSLAQAVSPILIIAKVAVVATVAYLTIAPVLQIWAAHLLTDISALGEIWQTSVRLLFHSGMLMVILGAIDYGVQWWKQENSLKMTRHEIKEELKMTEGSPQVKQQIRQRMQRLSQARMIEKVPQATVVVTNPTRLAVAIKYEARQMDSPQVVAKGKDFLAQKIRDIARDNQIPIVAEKPLAWALYKSVEIGQAIPPQFYKAVAMILVYVYQQAATRKKIR